MGELTPNQPVSASTLEQQWALEDKARRSVSSLKDIFGISIKDERDRLALAQKLSSAEKELEDPKLLDQVTREASNQSHSLGHDWYDFIKVNPTENFTAAALEDFLKKQRVLMEISGFLKVIELKRKTTKAV